MSDALIGLGVGITAGVGFFGGLRWTLSRLAEVRRPLLLAAASFVARSSFVVLLFLVITDGGLLRIVGGMAGLLALRTAMVAVVRRRVDPAEESSWT